MKDRFPKGHYGYDGGEYKEELKKQYEMSQHRFSYGYDRTNPGGDKYQYNADLLWKMAFVMGFLPICTRDQEKY